MKTPLQVGTFHEMGQWGFPQLGASRGSVYHLFERIGSEGVPGAKKVRGSPFRPCLFV